jgi:hypothetical protein
MKKLSDKKDRLERFVRDNREAFDSEIPSEAFWDKIESKLGPELPPGSNDMPNTGWGILNSRKIIWFDWRMVGMLFIGLGLGYLFFLNAEYGFFRDPQMAITAPSYAKEFTRYNSLIEEKRNDLFRLANENPEIYEDFSSELEQLEQNYNRLRKELPKTPNQDELIKAMIQNLQWQIDILNQQLKIINRINGNENQDEIYL